MRKSTSRGMNSCGRLSPWITPRTTRPNCKNGISNETPVPRRALPRRTHVPAAISASTASRKTTGCADVSSEKRTPSPVILRLRDHVGACPVVDYVRGTERLHEREPRLVHVDSDDRLASGYFSCHQAGQADGAHSEDGERIAWFGLHRIKYCTGARLPAAGERSEKFQRGILLDFHHVAFVGDGVGCEGGLLEEGAVNRSAILAHERGAIRTRPARLQVHAFHAVERHIAAAIRARAAPGKGDDDVIARREF